MELDWEEPFFESSIEQTSLNARPLRSVELNLRSVISYSFLWQLSSLVEVVALLGGLVSTSWGRSVKELFSNLSWKGFDFGLGSRLLFF